MAKELIAAGRVAGTSAPGRDRCADRLGALGGMDYPTRNNRLLQYELYDPDPNDPNTLTRRRTVSYTYYSNGDMSNITVKDEYADPVTTPGDPGGGAHLLALHGVNPSHSVSTPAPGRSPPPAARR